MSDSSRKSHGIGAAVDKLFRGIEILIAIFLGAMIFFTFMNVVLRQFGIGFPWSEEIARICFIYLIYLGAIIAARENQHLPSTLEATELFVEKKILFMPGKAANAGGVATSGLEQSQNSLRMSWSFEEVDEKLHGIMVNIFAKAADAAERYGVPGNYVAGANIAGFEKVVEAMMAQGIV